MVDRHRLVARTMVAAGLAVCVSACGSVLVAPSPGEGGGAGTGGAGTGGAGTGGTSSGGAGMGGSLGLVSGPGPVAMGDRFTCVVLEGGVVRCWGENYDGQLGYGHPFDLGDSAGQMPTGDVPLGGEATALVSGATSKHVCAFMTGGGVRCWGNNHAGKLGYGHDKNVGDNPGEMPPAEVPVGGEVIQLVAGANHTCALLVSGAVRCWGNNVTGALGYGTLDNLGDKPGDLPTPNVPLGGPVASIAGDRHTCALMVGGAVRCWGHNFSGQLGYAEISVLGASPSDMPPPDVDVGGTAAQVAVGLEHTCVLLDTGSVRCWGANGAGQLGYGHDEALGRQPGDMPTPDVVLGGKAVEIALGASHSCALLESGAVKCWGSGEYGQLGLGGKANVGDAPNQMPPQDVPIGGKAVRIVAGGDRTCAVLASGALRCWGAAKSGALGYGNQNNLGDNPDELPTPDVPIGGKLLGAK
jgi:alpha-tubulin suppressor-like RCC1 family protein